MQPICAFALALSAAFLFGCSSPSSQTVANSTTNLGIVETADRGTRHFTLSGRRDCQVRFTALTDDYVLIEAVVLQRDAQGHSKILARPFIKTRFGQEVALPIGDETLLLTPRRI